MHLGLNMHIFLLGPFQVDSGTLLSIHRVQLLVLQADSRTPLPFTFLRLVVIQRALILTTGKLEDVETLMFRGFLLRCWIRFSKLKSFPAICFALILLFLKTCSICFL